jgi:hypothetical protein
MEVIIGSYKLTLEVIILLVILLTLLFGHTLCSCCNVGFKEGLELMTGMDTSSTSTTTKGSGKAMGGSAGASGSLTEEDKSKIMQKMAISALTDKSTSPEDKDKIKKLMVMNAMKSKQGTEEDTTTDTTTDITTDTTTTEGFIGSNNSAEGPEFASNKDPGFIMNPDKWTSVVNYDYKKNTSIRPGELDIFANTEFKPECCPNTYSSSMGCACMSSDTYEILSNRGGNNVPYSQY